MLLLGLMAFVGCKQPNGTATTIVTPEEMQNLLKQEGIQFIDVRTSQEYDQGFIPKAINIDFFSPTFLESIESLDKEKPILIYCRSGRRSGKCSKKLEKVGFKKIYDLEGGYLKWKEKGFEVKIK